MANISEFTQMPGFDNRQVSVRRYIPPERWQHKVDPDQLNRTLQKASEALNQIGVTWWLGSGTLLGLNRSGNFLPGDNDLDIDIMTDAAVYQIIRKMPFFEVVRIVQAGNRYMQFALFDMETKAVLDMWFYHPLGDKLLNRNDFGIFWFPKAKFENLTTIEYAGTAFPAPDPNWFCEFRYGPHWREPKSYAGHWTEHYQKDCSGFVMTGNRHVQQWNYYPEA